MSGTVSQSRPSLADLLMGVQPPDGPIPLASMRMPSDLAGVPLASMFPVGQSLTMPSPDVSLMQPGSMPTTAQMAAQPVSQYVNPATGAFTPEGMQRARDVTDTAMAMGGVGPSGGGFRAYHGSPHAFDQFDLSKIGTGEGAQAYGHGMYLADAEGVARNYRDSLTPPQFSLEGVPHSEMDIQKSIARKVEDITGNAKVADNIAINTTQMLKTGRLGELENSINEADQLHPLIKQSWQAAFDHANAFTQERPPGHMYEVQVNADPAHFLDWDRPLGEQHPKVQAALVPHVQRAMDLEYTTPGDPLKYTGGDAYLAARSVMPGFNDPGVGAGAADVSQVLHAAGVPGIRYLDAGSRGAGEGSSNTVVFSPEIMNIIRRYGLAGLMAGGGAAAGMQQTGGDNTQ